MANLAAAGALGPLARGLAASTLGAAALCVVAAAIGVLSVHDWTYAVIASVAVMAVGVAFLDLGIFPALAVPATLLMPRVGGFLSISDVVLAAAAAVAVLRIDMREAKRMQPLLWAGGFYLATLVPTLILNPYTANVVEWTHELVLVLGSMIVGFVVGREGRARASVSPYVLGCCGIAVASVIAALLTFASKGQFEPVYLPALNKNFIGNSLAVAVVMCHARPSWLGWSRRWSYVAIVLCAAGIAASESRQAIISTALGVVVVSLRPHVDTRRRGRLVWFAAIPAMVFVVNAVNAQLQSSNKFNSSSQRLTWFGDSIDVWLHSPIFGVGLRWWYTSRFPVQFQPPNAEFEMLTSGGVVGLFGFLVMFSTAAWILTRMDPRYGTVALAVAITRFTQGQFDLYWVAGQASLLWIIAGMAFGVQFRERSGHEEAATPRARPRVSSTGTS